MPQVLLIEPDKELGGVIEKYLAHKGIKTLVSRTAQDAISKADQLKPDIIVLEIAMPKNNGVAFLQELRSYVDWMDVPVVVYSHISPEDTGLSQDDWQKQGVAVYLYKPTHSLASLTDNIENILNNYEKS